MWPLCKQDEDDIYLMATMQSCMNDAGFWAGEEDEADFYFGPSTVDALCYFQASVGLPETGVCDAATWRALLGDERFEWGPPPGAVGFEETSSDVTSSATQKVGATEKASASTDAEAEPLSAAAASAKAWSETAVTALVEDEDASATGREDLWGDEKSRNKTAFEEIRLRETQNPDLAKKNAKKWPVLRPEDGGWETHKLQVLLDEQGYYSGEEDMEYWYFGTTTENALGTFQASNGIPDTGLTCANTWRALLGEERFAMDAKAALETVGDGDYPLDLSRQDRVFLLGENRFEDRKVA
jgi:antiviral helicase SKI2